MFNSERMSHLEAESNNSRTRFDLASVSSLSPAPPGIFGCLPRPELGQASDHASLALVPVARGGASVLAKRLRVQAPSPHSGEAAAKLQVVPHAAGGDALSAAAKGPLAPAPRCTFRQGAPRAHSTRERTRKPEGIRPRRPGTAARTPAGTAGRTGAGPAATEATGDDGGGLAVAACPQWPKGTRHRLPRDGEPELPPDKRAPEEITLYEALQTGLIPCSRCRPRSA